MRRYAFDPVKLAAAFLGIEPEERDVLLVGSEHPYSCRCDTCKAWWKSMGPDPATGLCGSWTMEELGLDPKDWEWLFEKPPEGYFD
jgi:hypothetical protein